MSVCFRILVFFRAEFKLFLFLNHSNHLFTYWCYKKMNQTLSYNKVLGFERFKYFNKICKFTTSFLFWHLKPLFKRACWWNYIRTCLTVIRKLFGIWRSKNYFLSVQIGRGIFLQITWKYFDSFLSSRRITMIFQSLY